MCVCVCVCVCVSRANIAFRSKASVYCSVCCIYATQRDSMCMCVMSANITLRSEASMRCSACSVLLQCAAVVHVFRSKASFHSICT